MHGRLAQLRTHPPSQQKSPRMDQTEPDNYLENRLEPQLTWYNKRAGQNKRTYHWLQWTTIAISASVPALIAWAPDNLKPLTIALSVALAITTAALKTFRFQELWINYRSIARTLEREKHLFLARADPYHNTPNPLQLLAERTEDAMSNETETWVERQTRKEKKRGGEIEQGKVE